MSRILCQKSRQKTPLEFCNQVGSIGQPRVSIASQRHRSLSIDSGDTCPSTSLLHFGDGAKRNLLSVRQCEVEILKVGKAVLVIVVQTYIDFV